MGRGGAATVPEVGVVVGPTELVLAVSQLGRGRWRASFQARKSHMSTERTLSKGQGSLRR